MTIARTNLRTRRHKAFTLIEVLVTISIIMILMGILISALAGAKKSGYKVRTTAQLQGLSTACEAYFQVFSAYPGPIPDKDLAGSFYNTSTGNALSGTQNMMLGLMGRMQNTSTAGTTSTVTGVSTPSGMTALYVDTTPGSGPIDYNNLSAGLKTKSYSAFYVARGNGQTVTVAGYTYSLAADLAFMTGLARPNNFSYASPDVPTIVDSYPDALPILYYRRTPGVNTQTANPYCTNKGIAGSGQTPNAYNFLTNAVYTNSTGLVSPSGQTFNQNTTANSSIATTTSFYDKDLNSKASTGSTPATYSGVNFQYSLNNSNPSIGTYPTASTSGYISVAGGYMLVVACSDHRIYGHNLSTTAYSPCANILPYIGGQ